MKKVIIFLFFILLSFNLLAQNSIGIQAGFLGTHTSIAEYERIDRMDYLLDSMTINSNAGSLALAMNVDIDLGKNFFLSTGFHYSQKGLSNVTFTDSIGWPWTTPAKQHYVGLSLLAGYRFHIPQSKFGLQIATGPQVDFTVGTPNGGTLFSGPYYRFFMPFSKFNEVDLSWVGEAGCSYQLGPGDVIFRITYHYGLSDVLEDAFVVARSMSLGATIGYSFKLSK